MKWQFFPSQRSLVRTLIFSIWLMVHSHTWGCHAFQISSSTSSLRTSQRNYQTTETALLDTIQNHVDLKYIEFNDKVDSVGNDGDDPVILLHGLLGQKRNFASLGSALAAQLDKSRKIYAVDLRNHGDNTHDWREEMSYADMADDVLAFLDKHDMKKAILIGHSMGGKVAKSLALAHPERISGLVVLDISPVTYTEEDPSWNAVQSIIQSLKNVELTPGKTKREVDMDLRVSVEDPALRQFVLTNLETTTNKESSVQTLRWKINIDSISNQLNNIASFDVKPSVFGDASSSSSNLSGLNFEEMDLKYEGDLFLIKGGASSFVKGSHMPIISKCFPNYMLTTVRGAGHWIHAESPDATLALLKRYLDR